jgi:hypothetical protein
MGNNASLLVVTDFYSYMYELGVICGCVIGMVWSLLQSSRFLYNKFKFIY